MENNLAKLVFPVLQEPLHKFGLTGRGAMVHEVVALLDVPNGHHILLQNLQIVGSSQGNVLREEEKTQSTVISAENTPYHNTQVFHRIDCAFRVIS